MDSRGNYKGEQQKQGPDGRFARSFGSLADVEVTIASLKLGVCDEGMREADLEMMLNANPNAAKTMKHSLRGRLGTFWNRGICSSRVIVRSFLSQNVGPVEEENNVHLQ